MSDSKNSTGAQQAAATMSKINEAWLGGEPAKMEPYLDPNIVMALPGFGGRIEGRDKIVAGFVDMAENAKIQDFKEEDLQVDVWGSTAVVSYSFTSAYERDGVTYASNGHDLWVFTKDEEWRAVWRTMLDVVEEPA